MKLSENAEEILEELWTRSESEGTSRVNLEKLGIERENDDLKELVSEQLVTLSQNYVSLTAIGEPEAEKVVRRHRLAERLLMDILDVEDALIEETACKFEHLIREGIEENVCVLLGHHESVPTEIRYRKGDAVFLATRRQRELSQHSLNSTRTKKEELPISTQKKGNDCKNLWPWVSYPARQFE